MNSPSRRIHTGSAYCAAGLLIWAGASAAAPAGDVEAPATVPVPAQVLAVPSTMAFQGFLADSTGTPINGTVNLAFALYSTPTGGASLWSETQLGVSVSQGVFGVALGQVTPLGAGLFAALPRWLGVAVNGAAELPRTELRTSPFAFRAAVADSAAVTGAADDGDWTISGGDIYRTTGRVGVGTTAPQTMVDLRTAQETFDTALHMGVAGNATPNIDFMFEHQTFGLPRGNAYLFMSGGNGGSGNALSIAATDGNISPGTMNMLTPSFQPAMQMSWSSFGGDLAAYDSASQPVISLLGTTTGDAAVQLPAASVNASETATEPGVACRAFDSNIALTGGVQVIISRTITVPADGWVLAMASLQVAITHTSGTQSIGIFGLSDDGVSFGTAQDIDFILPSLLPSSSYFLPFHSSAVFAVTAGARTFYIVGQESAGGFEARETTLNLVYFPTAYGTVDPVLANAGPDDREAPGRAALSGAEIAAEQAEAGRFDDERIRRELDEVEARVAALKSELAARVGAPPRR
ncbi:MAG: hypothetical protein ACT4PE_06205 [Candidatus Eiseniibacteriota bacterium]